jgi:DNA-binding response OmpR family regulator
MVVDDERRVVEPMKLVLERNGIDVDAYTDPTDAVLDFRQGIYDLIVLDIRMPGMDGFSLYREIRKVDKGVRVCFLTAFDVSKAEFKSLFPEMVVCKFLTKPVAIGELLKEVRQEELLV